MDFLMGAFRGKLCPQIFRILANKAERRQTKNPLNTLYFSEFLHFREYQRTNSRGGFEPALYRMDTGFTRNIAIMLRKTIFIPFFRG